MAISDPAHQMGGARSAGGVRRLIGYLVTVAVPAGLVYLLVRFGAGGAGAGKAAHPAAAQVLDRLLIAVCVVIVAAHLLGALAIRVGQPRVIGEMIAGIVLGPSLLGLLLPGVQHALFPAQVLPYIDILSQLGVIFFMFLIGLELPLDLLRGSGSSSMVIGHAMIAVPFVPGVLLAVGMRSHYLPTGIGTVPFLLFLGLALSITAFPVLARILNERGLNTTRVGALGMTSAGIGDVTAWALLAGVVATVRNGSPGAILRTLLLTAVFAAVMWYGVRPALAWLFERIERRNVGSVPVLALLLAGVLLSAYATDWMGVHPIFGAFLAGLVIPRGSALVPKLTSKVEGLTMWFLVPLFFASVGLKMQISTLGAGTGWLWCGLIVVVAMAGKFIGTAAAARFVGENWRDSLGLSTMMNCRGLTELVVLTLGLSLGIIRPDLFAMLVIMALITTMITGPLLRVLYPAYRIRRDGAAPEPEPTT